MTDLQDALLPADLPVAPALDVSATYLLAADDARAGGDWFDAIVRSDGTVALVVGDTVGQGIKASAVMGQLRAVLHERLLADDSIPEALRSLDRYARVHPESHAATVCVVRGRPGVRCRRVLHGRAPGPTGRRGGRLESLPRGERRPAR